MQAVSILSGQRLKRFCEETKINYTKGKILIKINGKRAEYYNFDDDCFYRLGIEIAKKYI